MKRLCIFVSMPSVRLQSRSKILQSFVKHPFFMSSRFKKGPNKFLIMIAFFLFSWQVELKETGKEDPSYEFHFEP